jgi:hypothetical protein
MADNIWANWNIVQIVYGSGGPSEPMVDRKKLGFFTRVNPWIDKTTNQARNVKTT